MDTVKIKLKADQALVLQYYIELCADACMITAYTPVQVRLTYYVVHDLRDEIRKKLNNDQQTYTIKFKPFQAIVFLMIQTEPVGPYPQTVIRQVREDLHQALISDLYMTETS